jgi:hypothetical protein
MLSVLLGPSPEIVCEWLVTPGDVVSVVLLGICAHAGIHGPMPVDNSAKLSEPTSVFHVTVQVVLVLVKCTLLIFGVCDDPEGVIPGPAAGAGLFIAASVVPGILEVTPVHPFISAAANKAEQTIINRVIISPVSPSEKGRLKPFTDQQLA